MTSQVTPSGARQKTSADIILEKLLISFCALQPQSENIGKDLIFIATFKGKVYNPGIVQQNTAVLCVFISYVLEQIRKRPSRVVKQRHSHYYYKTDSF